MKKLIFGSFCTLAASAAFGQNLVLNPGFELSSGVNVVPTDWSIQNASSGSLYIVSNNPTAAHSGNNYFEFGATSGIDDVVYQTISTIAGATYTYSIWYQGNGGTGQDLNVYWNTSTFGGTGNVFSSTSLNQSSYTQLSFTVTATSNSTVIGIGGYNGPSYTYLDDVSVVQATPEPASMAVLGLGALALLRRRRR